MAGPPGVGHAEDKGSGQGNHSIMPLQPLVHFPFQLGLDQHGVSGAAPGKQPILHRVDNCIAGRIGIPERDPEFPEESALQLPHQYPY